MSSAASEPVADSTGATFWLADAPRRPDAVRLVQEIGLTTVDFAREPGGWRLRIPRLAVDRMEYLLEITDHDGHHTTITDPGNPLRVGGAFGDKSELRFPDYDPPDWLDEVADAGTTDALAVPAPRLADTMLVEVWSPAGLAPDAPAPLVLVHDGPEYARLGRITHYLAVRVGRGTLPPVRAALVAPGARNAWYSANPDYAASLADALRTTLRPQYPTTCCIGVGVSLGALSLLHAQWSYPELFDALMLQSGSFFTPVLDPQEQGFSGFGAVTGFVSEVVGASAHARPVPATLTCGLAEENLANNRTMAMTLSRLGYSVPFVEQRDAHNYTAWRDALDPALADLITTVAAAHAS